MAISKVRAVSGDAEVIGIPQPKGERVQVGVEPISASGTVTITVRAAGETTYKAVTDGTIDLSAPQTILIYGAISAIKATSTDLEYDLIVSGK